MKVKKSLFLSLCSLVLMMQFSYVAGEKTKDGYEIIPLEEFNNLYPNEVPRKIIIPNYYGGGKNIRIYMTEYTIMHGKKKSLHAQ